MNYFEKVGQILKEWAVLANSARGEVIVNITVEAIKNLAGEDCLNLQNEFVSYIKEFRRREGVFHSITNYRDHFIHPFHVFCLGYCILYEWKDKGLNPLRLTENWDEDANLKIWFISSIYHDVGFPAEKLEVMVKHFFKTSIGRETGSQFDWSSVLLADNNIEHIAELSRRFNMKAGAIDYNTAYKWFYKRLAEDHDHGVLTALMLLNQGWSESEWDIAYEAALAIALHSWKREPHDKFRILDESALDLDIGPLAVEDFPIAFYLSFCDCAQEWGRKVLLGLIEEAANEVTDEEIEFFRALDSRLENVNCEKKEVSGEKKIKTLVKIAYPSDKNDDICNGKTLGEIFETVSKKFGATWYLKNGEEKDFIIEGEDKFATFGYIHPSPTKPISVDTDFYLNQLSEKLRSTRGKKLERSIILKAILKAMSKANIDFSEVTSEEKLIQKIEEALNKSSVNTTAKTVPKKDTKTRTSKKRGKNRTIKGTLKIPEDMN